MKDNGRAVFDKEQTLETSSADQDHTEGPDVATANSSNKGEVSAPVNPDAKPATADMQAFIGRQLRAVYDDIARQPVPDRFLELMKQLEGKPASG